VDRPLSRNTCALLFHQKSQPLKGLGFGPQKVQLGNFKVWLRRVN